MKKPFTYVVYIDRGKTLADVFVYQSLGEAEALLRSYGKSYVCSPCDDEIVERLAQVHGWRVKIFAITQTGNGQTRDLVNPFARAKAG